MGIDAENKSVDDRFITAEAEKGRLAGILDRLDQEDERKTGMAGISERRGSKTSLGLVFVTVTLLCLALGMLGCFATRESPSVMEIVYLAVISLTIPCSRCGHSVRHEQGCRSYLTPHGSRRSRCLGHSFQHQRDRFLNQRDR
jgi:hypothetical protein